MRRLVTSALFALSLALTATGQPPAQPKGKPADDKKEKKPDATDAAIAAALAHDADVKVAQAKMQLAEAELAKARQAVTIKVVTLKAKVEQLKAQLAPVEQQLAIVTERYKAGAAQYAEVLAAREKVEVAKSSLAVAEAEWKLLTGPGAGVSAGQSHEKSVASALLWLSAQQSAPDPDAAATLLQYLDATGAAERAVVKGPVAERLRAALDKPVKLGPKGQKVTLADALAVFKKEAGLDVPMRPTPVPWPEILSEGEELPVGAWFQLFQDVGGRESEGFTFYVREYGLLVANRQTAPPDAPTLTQFWKQKPPAKETKAETTTGKR